MFPESPCIPKFWNLWISEMTKFCVQSTDVLCFWSLMLSIVLPTNAIKWWWVVYNVITVNYFAMKKWTCCSVTWSTLMLSAETCCPEFLSWRALDEHLLKLFSWLLISLPWPSFRWTSPNAISWLWCRLVAAGVDNGVTTLEAAPFSALISAKQFL